MNENTKKALQILQEKNASLVLVKGEDIVIFEKESVKNLVNLCDSSKDFYGYSAALKTLGRASAFLLVNLEVSECYAKNLLKLAVHVLDRGDIVWQAENTAESFSDLADNIKNEEAFETFEEAVIRSGNSVIALQDIRRSLSAM